MSIDTDPIWLKSEPFFSTDIYKRRQDGTFETTPDGKLIEHRTLYQVVGVHPETLQKLIDVQLTVSTQWPESVGCILPYQHPGQFQQLFQPEELIPTHH